MPCFAFVLYSTAVESNQTKQALRASDSTENESEKEKYSERRRYKNVVRYAFTVFDFVWLK